MKSRKAIIGTLALGVLALVSLLGIVTGQDAIAEVARTVLVLLTSVLVLAGVLMLRRLGRRVESTYRKVDHIYRHGAVSRSAVPPEVGKDDLVGMLRLVQAQYVGRLDQALASLEDATQRLTSIASDGMQPVAPAVLTVEPREEYVPAVEAAIQSGAMVVIRGSAEEAHRWVTQHEWYDKVTLPGQRHTTDAGASEE